MTLHSHAKKPKSGTWLVSCDVCGIIHLNTQVKLRWDNLYVCEADWERNHPQKLIKLPPERIAAPFQRVESVDGTGNSFIPLCTIFSNQAVAGAAEAGCSVAGTWKLRDQGGSLLTPPSTPAYLYPTSNSLTYLFRGEGPNNSSMNNTAPDFESVYQNSNVTQGVSNQNGYFNVGITWPAAAGRIAWNTRISGLFSTDQIDTLNFSGGCWFFSPTVGISGRGIIVINFNNQIVLQIGGNVAPPSTFLLLSSTLLTPIQYKQDTPLDLVGWNHCWFRIDNGVVNLYINGQSIFTATAALSVPSIRYYTPVDGTVGLLDTGDDHASGIVDEVVFLRNIGIAPPPLSAPFVVTPPVPPPPPPPPGTPYRYWRLIDFVIPGGSFLEISELRLTNSGVDVLSGTISSSTAPLFSTVSVLYDGSLFTRCYWSEATVETPGFFIAWDYGAGNEQAITGFKQGGFDTSSRYIEACTAQYSSDGVSWTTLGSASGVAYPGNNTLSSNILFA